MNYVDVATLQLRMRNERQLHHHQASSLEIIGDILLYRSGRLGCFSRVFMKRGAMLDQKFTVHRFCEPAVRLLEGPFSHMKPMLADMFARARTCEAQGKRIITERVLEIDSSASNGYPKKMPEEISHD